LFYIPLPLPTQKLGYKKKVAKGTSMAASTYLPVIGCVGISASIQQDFQAEVPAVACCVVYGSVTRGVGLVGVGP